jgi:hypothetical protein
MGRELVVVLGGADPKDYPFDTWKDIQTLDSWKKKGRTSSCSAHKSSDRNATWFSSFQSTSMR